VSSRFKRKGGGHDATGRTKNHDAWHFRLYHWFVDTPAWRDLTPAERCVYLEIELRFNGANNGAIGLSSRTAGKACRISKETALKCFQGLIDHGFTECRTPGGFSTNSCLAPEWRLTRAKCDVTGERATMAFKKWSLPPVEAGKRAILAAQRAARVPKRSPKRLPVLSETTASRGAKVA
jgi:hypothetical protein